MLQGRAEKHRLFYVDDFCLFVRNFYTVNIDGDGAKVFHVERIGSRFPSLRVRLALLAQDDTGGSKQKTAHKGNLWAVLHSGMTDAVLLMDIDELASCQAGFFGADAHQVAFHRGFKGGSCCIVAI